MNTFYSEKPTPIQPLIIIHGGAGNITRHNLPKEAYLEYRKALLDVLRESNALLARQGATALDVATHAVHLLENNALFNSGHGAVYTREGTHELEASVMVSSGYRKRGVGVMQVTRAKNPILLAKEMLIRGERDDGGGAQGHCQLAGEPCDRLAAEWGLDIARPEYFWVRKRWDEHRRGLGLEHSDETYEKHRQHANDGLAEDHSVVLSGPDLLVNTEAEYTCMNDPSWDGKEYLPQGTVGAVVLDSSGAYTVPCNTVQEMSTSAAKIRPRKANTVDRVSQRVASRCSAFPILAVVFGVRHTWVLTVLLGTTCVATSTGGITNKLPGRIGDTPTIGAGFWAEEWQTTHVKYTADTMQQNVPKSPLTAFISDCLPGLRDYISLPSNPTSTSEIVHAKRAVAMSGTGNGDSFLRVNAVRTAAAIARYSGSSPFAGGLHPLQQAVSSVAGPGGALQQSAEDRWHKTGEGEGGIIGIDYDEVTGGKVVADFNCGGMFRVWVDDEGKERMAVFRDE